jgi:cytochrome c oxidase cbb3-type subunit III
VRIRILPLVCAALACQGERAPIATGGPAAGLGRQVVRTSELIAGGTNPGMAMRNPFERDKQVLVDGRRYYGWFNCAGCHGGAGGGGIGPPLADGDWIYGGEPANIFLTIVQGRPNGMPSYGVQLSDDEVWKLVAYVSSLSAEAEVGK